jgi:hypothetical protein
MYQATRRDDPRGGRPRWWVTAGAVTAILLLGAGHLSAQAPRPAADPAPDDLAEVQELHRLLQSLLQMREQQMQQVLNMHAAQLGTVRGFGKTSAAEFRLGARLEPPGDALVEQLDLPAGQGQTVTKVTPGEPADRAGVQPHDILLEVDGNPVPSDPTALTRFVADIKAKVPVDVVVLHKGAKKKLPGLTLAEAPAAGAGNGPRGLGLAHGPLGLPGNGAAGVGGPNAKGGGTFTASVQQDGVSIDVDGTVDNGAATVTDITITDGDKPRHFTSVDKVPEEYREKVRGLIDKATRRRAGASAAKP